MADKTRKNIESMSQRDRTWETLSTQYGKQKEASNAAYDQEISKQDRAMVQRGMQRSSYGANALSNLRSAKVKAANDIDSEMLSTYASALNDIENREQEQSNWEREFTEGQRQHNENLAFQKSEAARQQKNENWNQAFQQKQADIAQKNTQWEQNFQQKQADISQKNTEWQQAFQKSEAAREQANTEWNQQFQTSEAARQQKNTEWEQKYQEAQSKIQQEQWQKQFDAANEQWKQQFDYNKMSDDQKLAYNYIVQAASLGNDVSDAMLKKAGISRQDYNALKAKVAEITASTGGGGGGKTTNKPTTEPEKPSESSLVQNMFGKTSGSNQSKASTSGAVSAVNFANNTIIQNAQNREKKTGALKTGANGNRRAATK